MGGLSGRKAGGKSVDSKGHGRIVATVAAVSAFVIGTAAFKNAIVDLWNTTMHHSEEADRKAILDARQVAPDLVATLLSVQSAYVDLSIVNRGLGSAYLDELKLVGYPPSLTIDSGVELADERYSDQIEVPKLPRSTAPFRVNTKSGPRDGLIVELVFHDELKNKKTYSQSVRPPH